GAITALAFDYILRVVRANMLEREAIEIDTEVSEFFFSRSSDVRLDARPAGIGTMAAQLRGLEQVRQMLSSSMIFAMADLPFALLFIFVIAQLGGPLAFILLIAFPLAVGLALLLAHLIRRDTERAQISGNRKNGLLVESLDAAETIKANRGQWYLLSRWNTLLDEVHDAELPVRKLQAQASSIFSTLQQIAYISMIAWGAVRIYDQQMSMGALIACSILAGRVNGPLISQLPGLLVQWSYSRSSLKLLDGILALPPDRPVGMDQLRPNRLEPQITVKDLKFAYQGGRAGIVVPTLDIAAGERVGIIGGVGSGKSTLLKVLSGLYAPAEGQVLMNKLDMSQIADDVLREHIGYLPQDYRLVNGTLRENLLLGLPDPGDDRIMEVAQQTGLEKLITSNERGLDLFINEGGRGLSGGQRVLTGLTRLLLARPKLLLLDEPTANLDVETEALVLRAIVEQLDPETTLILVTHKLQLTNLTNRLMIVANGQIAVDGPTAEVLKQLTAPAQQPAEAAAAAQPPKTGITTTIGARTQ
ncbi:MAG: ATP-binding cassette domain-containing protein, partial [Novosphingobium sp.]|nr:ATP-binding cassette domain-containing protein [Novosphingobium sp.]